MTYFMRQPVPTVTRFIGALGHEIDPQSLMPNDPLPIMAEYTQLEWVPTMSGPLEPVAVRVITVAGF